MGAVGVWITDPLNDSQFSRIMQRFQVNEAWIQSYMGIKFQNFVWRQRQFRPNPVITVISKWDDRI